MKKGIKSYWLYLGLVLSIFFSLTQNAYGVDGFYLGGHVGHVALSGEIRNSYSNSIGFGADLALQVSPVLDVLFQSQFSPHSGPIESFKLFSNTLDANLHLWQFGDFDFTLQGGSGFYFLSALGLSESKFGLNFGGGVDVIADERLRVGLDGRYHLLFGTHSSNYNYWTTMMRIGYWFVSN